MYTGFKPNISVTKSITSVDPSETQLETLQREVDNYTRKLEQEKRKFFSIQDYLKNTTEEYDKEKGKLNELKKENSKAHNVMLQAKVKNLEANLDKAISTFNDTVAHNNKLKNDIDMLRREKKNYIEMLGSLEQQIQKYEEESQNKLVMIESKKRRAEEVKEEIVRIKEKNEMERDQYIKQF
jgi:chromosome segregation ATPase